MDENATTKRKLNENTSKLKLWRCAAWLHEQNNDDPTIQNEKELNLEECNLKREKFLKTSTGDNISIPSGVDELPVKPTNVSVRKLRVEKLHLECEWKVCRWNTDNYEQYQRHVSNHLSDLFVINKNGAAEYVCLWDICGHKTMDRQQIIRHVNYHAYHAKLMAVGFNGRATLKLVSCKKDSSSRNILPPLLNEHKCMWVGCDGKFNAVQTLYNHIREHVNYSDGDLCSWGGCGLRFPRKSQLVAHVRTHTGERVIACSHCGAHFANNRKLCDHLRRQNASAASGHECTMCGAICATEYLLREHCRRHVNVFACALCDMSAPSRSALADHVTYRHLPREHTARSHQCPHCEHRSVTKWDLRKHITTHVPKTKRKRRTSDSDDEQESDQESDETQAKKKKYICHMCPKISAKLFTRGARLTSHLVKVHGVQWPFGHSRFRYQVSEDGMYRLTTTRYESLEVSRQIVDGHTDHPISISNTTDFVIEKVADATEETPQHYVVSIQSQRKPIEITMCDVDEEGNIISEQVMTDVVFT